MPDKAYYETLIASCKDSPRRIERVEADGKILWIKRESKNLLNPLQHNIEHVKSTLRGHKIRHGLKNEIACIAAMRKRGAIVPDIVYESDGWLVLSDIGTSMQILMQEAAPDLKYDLAQKAAKALGELHAKGGWHGSGRLRDMTMSDRGVGFIDFESAADPIMPLWWRQAQDVWLLCHSTARFDSSGTLTAHTLKSYPHFLPKLMVLLLTVLILPLYLILRPFRDKLGRDVVQAIGCSEGILRWAFKF